MNILVFGDSIVWGAADLKGGWVQRLRRMLDSKVTFNYNVPGEHFVYNLGITDETSDKLLKRFRKEAYCRISSEDENALIFQIGENDSRFVKLKKGFEVNISKFECNIKDLIMETKRLTSHIVFVGLFPVNEEKTSPLLEATEEDVKRGLYYKNENIEKFNKIIAKVCKTERIPFVDVYSQFSKVDYKRLLFRDGLHLNASGHQKIFKMVEKELLRNKIIRLG